MPVTGKFVIFAGWTRDRFTIVEEHSYENMLKKIRKRTAASDIDGVHYLDPFFNEVLTIKTDNDLAYVLRLHMDRTIELTVAPGVKVVSPFFPPSEEEYDEEEVEDTEEEC